MLGERYRTRCFHLDVGGQVGVWHSDAVMQPGPRDDHGSTIGDIALPRVGREAYKAEVRTARITNTMLASYSKSTVREAK